MSALLARLGLAESRAVSLSVLGRGSRRLVRRGWLGVGYEQARKASWQKKSYDEGMESGEFGLGGSSEQEGEEQREAHRKTSELIRDKDWGVSNAEQEDTDPRWENKTQNPKLSWSQGSEDAFWDAASRPVDADEHAPKRQDSHMSAWGNPDYEMQGDEKTPKPSTQKAAPDGSELSWSQRSEDAFWEMNSSSADDLNVDEQANTWQPYSSQADGSLGQSRQGAGEHKPSYRIDYVTCLPIAIKENDQDKVARCLFAAEDCRDHDFISGISEESFTDILHVLEPRQNTQELSNIYMETSDHMARHIGLMSVDRLMAEHGQMMYDVAMMRKRCGCRLTGAHYLILLKSAVNLGSSKLTRQLWQGLGHDGVVPDIDMYNAYMASFIWAGYNYSTARYRERVTNYNLAQRRANRMDRPWSNYHIGLPWGIREKSIKVLDAMLENGVTANEETYCSLIIAAAKEGEMGTVNSVLRTVWGIDVARVMSARPSSPKALPRDSVHHPTSKLLWTVAYTFCINNKIPEALRLVDYVSREYDIAIDSSAWAVLFEFTFVLASRRSGTAARDDRKTGQLPIQAVEQLFTTMTRAPYFVEPTMGMYNRLIKNLSSRDSPNKMRPKMISGAALNAASINVRNRAWKFLKLCLVKQSKGEEYASIAVARRQWEVAAVTCARNRLWMKSWVFYFLNSLSSWHRSKNVRMGNIRTHVLTMHHVPELLRDWHRYAGAYVKYDLPTGVLEIQLQSEADILRAAMWRETYFLDRQRVLDRAKLLVGNELLVPSAEDVMADGSSMRAVAATTTRLRAARERAAAEGFDEYGVTKALSRRQRQFIEDRERAVAEGVDEHGDREDVFSQRG